MPFICRMNGGSPLAFLFIEIFRNESDFLYLLALVRYWIEIAPNFPNFPTFDAALVAKLFQIFPLVIEDLVVFLVQFRIDLGITLGHGDGFVAGQPAGNLHISCSQ
jgi:hypothetical protein